MPAPRVLVTRPAAAAAAWVAQLARHGIAAEALPLIEILPEPLTGSLAQARRQLSRYAAVMFVSGNAVTSLLGSDHIYFDKSGSDHDYFEQNSAAVPTDQAQAAIETRAWSPGPGTTQALLAAGWPRARIDEPAADAAQFDSEALWAQVAPQVRAGLRVLIVRGGDAAGRLAGRDWLAQRLQQAGAQVDQLLAYRRAAPVLAAAARSRALAAAADGTLWLFSSSEAVANLRQCLPAADWRGARALATHPRIAQAAREAGFGAVADTRPALADVVASIESLA
ncbi:MAG: uroporphyrinogen-III synthase [Burkholderiales bacterium]|uniref:uroporphyrinogen-III synthase n=1 Tax=Ottowia sp. TaxID=1898956 RepID=UPI001AC2145F|nr:uroporphyrinogen-III synthase [Ottowia sp.]MBN9406671.1 uroporphyrinogen-III synthase [Burkholderiales bacterium]